MLNLKIKEKLMFFYPALISFMVSAILAYTFMWIDVERSNALNRLKLEFNKMDKSFNEIGLDIAYEKISFNRLFPFNLLTIQDFKIYRPVENNYFAIDIPEFRISTGLFNPRKININFGDIQTITIGENKYDSNLKNLDINLSFDNQTGLKNIVIEGKDIIIKNFANIENLKLASRRIAPMQINELTPFFENYVEINNIKLDENIDFPLSKNIERIYFNANIVGLISNQDTYKSSLNSWVKLGGNIDIKKLVINWNPLVLVSRGDIFFSEKDNINLHLNTSSKAFIPTLTTLQEAGILESKGVFVVKILLNNKSFKINKDDNFFTVTTPIEIKEKQMFIENIKVLNFN